MQHEMHSKMHALDPETDLLEGFEYSIGHVILNHEGGDEDFGEGARVGPQRLIDRLRLLHHLPIGNTRSDGEGSRDARELKGNDDTTTKSADPIDERRLTSKSFRSVSCKEDSGESKFIKI